MIRKFQHYTERVYDKYYSLTGTKDDFIKREAKNRNNICLFNHYCRIGLFKDKNFAEWLRPLALQGFTNEMRYKIWPLLAMDGIEDDLIIDYQKKHVDAKQKYVDVILKDIRRTFAGTVGNEAIGEEKIQELSNILISYSAIDSTIGYTQGMNFLASIPLLFAEEEISFWIFYGLMNNPRINLRTLYVKKLLGFFELSDLWMELLWDTYPWLAKKILSSCYAPPLIVSKCFQSLIISFSIPLQIKIMMFDRILVFGKQALVSFPMIMIHLNLTQLRWCHQDNIQYIIMNADKQEEMQDIDKVIKLWDEEWISDQYMKTLESRIKKDKKD